LQPSSASWSAGLCPPGTGPRGRRHEGGGEVRRGSDSGQRGVHAAPTRDAGPCGPYGGRSGQDRMHDALTCPGSGLRDSRRVHGADPDPAATAPQGYEARGRVGLLNAAISTTLRVGETVSGRCIYRAHLRRGVSGRDLNPHGRDLRLCHPGDISVGIVAGQRFVYVSEGGLELGTR
jgi:hypothetical protein